VELFVEVESATHRLSEVMQKDEKFQHVPGWFEHVSELGASLLVQATGKVFRVYGTPMDDNKGNEDEDTNKPMNDDEKAEKEEALRVEAAMKKHQHREQSLLEIHTIDPLDRRSLLSLEFLVTTMFIFKASECRDSVYSMLGIARDAAPYAEPTSSTNDVSFRMSLFEGFLAEKPFLVDYARPYSDVCRDFMEFCIQRKNTQDPVQALDILCRPWALEPQQRRSNRLDENVKLAQIFPLRDKSQRWRKRKCKARAQQEPFKWIYEKQKNDAWTDDERDMQKYREENKEKEEGKRDDPSWVDGEHHWKVPEGWDKVEACLKGPRRPKPKRGNVEMELDIDLPSWIPRAKNAPFEIYRHPGIQIKKTGRANADPLVGWPQDGHRNYSAAQTETVKLECLKFRKRPHMGHYSLYVAGFVLDEVDEVRDASQGGSIPNSWLEMSGWDPPYDKDPPAEFWRTIVADRGFDNRNPPYYYARACRESVNKGGRESGSVNTTALINNERNSIIAEFCRRVHAVIWGRSLFRTRQGKLGLAKDVKKGDLVCVLHGCTVPVILSRRTKKEGEREEEEFEDRFEAFKSCVRRMKNIRVRKRRYEQQKERSDKQGEAHEEQSERHEIQTERPAEEQAGNLPGNPPDSPLNNPQNNPPDSPQNNLSKWQQDVVSARDKANAILSIDGESRIAQKALDDKRKHVLAPTKDKDNGDKTKEPSPRFKPDKETFYIFKGESYVHGCMDGEAVRNRFYGTEEERVFEMR
jgi:hypothetical protein